MLSKNGKKKLKKNITKKSQEKSRKSLTNKAWKLMSEWVRKSNSDWRGNVTCFSCGKQLPWQESQAGHFHHGKLDFDEQNIHVQCVGCNKWKHGNLSAYSVNLIKEIGKEAFLDLARRASRYTRYEIPELEKIIEELTKKLREILTK